MMAEGKRPVTRAGIPIAFPDLPLIVTQIDIRILNQAVHDQQIVGAVTRESDRPAHVQGPYLEMPSTGCRPGGQRACKKGPEQVHRAHDQQIPTYDSPLAVHDSQPSTLRLSAFDFL